MPMYLPRTSLGMMIPPRYRFLNVKTRWQWNSSLTSKCLQKLNSLIRRRYSHHWFSLFQYQHKTVNWKTSKMHIFEHIKYVMFKQIFFLAVRWWFLKLGTNLGWIALILSQILCFSCSIAASRWRKPCLWYDPRKYQVEWNRETAEVTSQNPNLFTELEGFLVWKTCIIHVLLLIHMWF
jgi:hypothetical protein